MLARIIVGLTAVRTAPGFCTLRAFTTWNTSTTPSVLHRSMVVAMAQNMPLRLTVSLQERHSLTHTHTPHTLTHSHTYTPPLTHSLTHSHTYTPHSLTHSLTHTQLHTCAHTHPLSTSTAHLQCTTMGRLPVLLWTLPTSSITSVTVFRLEQLPSGAQLVMWNWLT